MLYDRPEAEVGLGTSGNLRKLSVVPSQRVGGIPLQINEMRRWRQRLKMNT